MVALATFQVLDIEHFHYCRRFLEMVLVKNDR